LTLEEFHTPPAVEQTKAATTSSISSESLLEEFHVDCLDRGMTGESVRRYESCLGTFFSFLKQKGVKVSKVGYDELISYIRFRRTNGGNMKKKNNDGGEQEQAVKQKTLENDFAAISSFFDFLEFKRYVQRNPVPPIRKRYLVRYKESSADDSEKDAISIEKMSMLINSILNTRDKAVVILLAKTGIRRGELIALNVQDIDWQNQCLTLGRFKKRSNRWVFFDDETGRVLKQWLKIREGLKNPTSSTLSSDALFLNERGDRLQRNGVYSMLTKYAQKVGLHNPKSDKARDHFNVHSCRHWYTTWLRRNGMDRDAIMILRGDRRKESMSVYDHFSKDELRKAYLAHTPQLGI
jgi:integrase/recombinase XerD